MDGTPVVADRSLETLKVRYRVDSSWRHHHDDTGHVVIAGSPVRIFRFRPAAHSFLQDLEEERDLSLETLELQARLLAAGAIHPVTGDGIPGAPDLDDITVVIPVHEDDHSHLHALVSGLPTSFEIILVDDGSPSPLGSIDGTTILRNEHAHGPASARNRGARLASRPYLLFLDADVHLPSNAEQPRFWQALFDHFADPNIALVAPRLASVPGTSALARYEELSSPLDMGGHFGRIAPGTRIPYAPSAALLVRSIAFEEMGGFTETLRYGEDVDFVWRLHEAGLLLRYEPSVVLYHAPRTSWTALFRQRFQYGTSAAPLEQRHPRQVRPFHIDRWSAVVFGLVFSRHFMTAAFVTTSNVWRLARRIGTVPKRWIIAVRLIFQGYTYTARSFPGAMTRTWWPITWLLCLISRRGRWSIVVYIALRAAWRTRSHLGSTTVVYILAKTFDDAAYGSGVWWGALRSRRTHCLMPRVD